MIYKFKSQAAAEVIMLQPDAETMLKIIGKTPGARGIVTVDQIPGAISALHQAIEDQKKGIKPPPLVEKDGDDESNDQGVSLEKRVGPFIKLMQESAAAGKDVVWGV